MRKTTFKKFPHGSKYTIKRIVEGFEFYSNYLLNVELNVEGVKFDETSTEHHAQRFSSQDADNLINLLSK